MIQKIREKLNIQTLIHVVPAALFLLFIFSVMFFTYTGKVKKAVTDTKLSVESLGKLSDSFEKTLRDNIYGKNYYIDLNGLSTRILGINSLNERQKLKNGYLSYFEGIKDIKYEINGIIELNDFLVGKGLAFLYILVPGHASFYDAEFAPGYSSESWKNIDKMINSLNEAGVNNIDMDAWFEENGWTMEDVFFKTDHHWLPGSGFQAAKLTMSQLCQIDGISYDPATLDEENWEIEILEQWSLGSNGKRTGALYTGLDDFPIYFPEYETDYEYSYLRSNTTDWTYSDSPLNLIYSKRKDFFKDVVHSIYLGGDYPLRRISNTKAVNDKKILIMGDSNRRPYEYFMSTQFQEVYGIDLRYYTDGTLAQYVEEISPDVVIMLTSETEIGTKSLYTFGVSDYNIALQETDNEVPLKHLVNISIDAQEDNANNFMVVCDNLEPNQAYTLTLDSTTYDGGNEWYVQMTLQNLSSNKAVCNRYFDANSNETQKWFFTTPENITGKYSIYLYAGTKGHTKGVSVSVSNVTLRKGIFED